MRLLISIAAAAVVGHAVTLGQTAALADADVSTILRALGAGDRAGVFLQPPVNVGECNGFSLTVWSPESWVRDQARQARRHQRTLTVGDVSPEMRQRIWRVRAMPSQPYKVDDINAACADSVGDVIITSPNRPGAIAPIARTPMPAMPHPASLAIQFTGLTATFEDRDVRDAWGPAQNRPFVISVVGTKGRKQDFQIKAKHFGDLK